MGGVVGLVVDTRGRPFEVPTDAQQRVAQLTKWQSALDAIHKSLITLVDTVFGVLAPPSATRALGVDSCNLHSLHQLYSAGEVSQPRRFCRRDLRIPTPH